MLLCKLTLRFAVLVGMVLVLANCAEQRPEEIPGKFERGIRGEGTIYQPTREGDPFIKENARSGI
jgi:hypothetical protein